MLGGRVRGVELRFDPVGRGQEPAQCTPMPPMPLDMLAAAKPNSPSTLEPSPRRNSPGQTYGVSAGAPVAVANAPSVGPPRAHLNDEDRRVRHSVADDARVR